MVSSAVDATKVHRALGDPSRVRILAELRASTTPVAATELAARVGLHANTVRSHLRILEEAQLVTALREDRTTPGRPRLGYVSTPEGVSHEERAGYRLLAEILASHLAGSGKDASQQAEAAGQAWGRYFIDQGPAVARGSADDDVRSVVRLLAEFGFDPQVEPDATGHTVLMQHCPFGEAADQYRKVVCSVHLGLMQGALSELGAGVEAEALEPFVRPGVCAAHLGQAPARAVSS
jgi:predicted ArsR family transcriptional regulator